MHINRDMAGTGLRAEAWNKHKEFYESEMLFGTSHFQSNVFELYQ